MLGGEGVYRGSGVLISGTAGTGKSSLSSHFADASCRRGERCLYFAFEESVGQISRNMRSIGLDLQQWVRKGLLRVLSGRPTLTGLEMHLAIMHKEIRTFQPRLVIVDPISNLAEGGTLRDATAMLARLLDFLKSQQITGLFTSLTTGGNATEATEVGISSVIDTWLLLRDIELGGERNRGIYVLKSRGMAHSNQIREFLLTDKGVDLLDVYNGPEGVLTGSMRLVQEARDQEQDRLRKQEQETQRRAYERKRRALEVQILELKGELEAEELAYRNAIGDATARDQRITAERTAIARSRKADGAARVSRRNGKPGARP
jgi:circadian clock protein KaiC